MKRFVNPGMRKRTQIGRKAMNPCLIAVVGLAVLAGGALAALNPYELPGDVKPESPIDKLVFAKLNKLGVPPAYLCSDPVFVRRAYLDVIGTLPSGFEAQQFILDKNPNKRAALIDKLLERPEFADYWAMKWSDLLRVKAEFPINLWPNAAQAYHRWILASVRDHKPYDQFVRELLTSSGSNFRVGPVNFYRAMQGREPQGIAQTVALTFMGTRADKWPTNKLAGMAGFFTQISYKSTGEWKEEIVFFDPAGDTNQVWKTATFPDGKPAKLTPEKDPREVFANWLIDPKNPWFTHNIANRAWSWLLGRGIVQEPDDLRPDNPPVNPELLAYLEKELISAHYDLKQLFRLILNSKTYQLSSISRSNDPKAAENFAAYPLRRLEAEVLIDALNQITGSAEKYSSAIPEPFTFIPEDQRSISLPDGSISSPFLEMFGRPSRDTGLESERNNRSTPAQRLHLLNSSQIQRKIEQSRMIQFQTESNKTPQEIATGIYLGMLSRYPTENETKTASERFSGAKKHEAAVDLAWALLNSAEFLHRH
jgi:hypothetical protein